MAKTTLNMDVQKATDGTVVFKESVNADDLLAAPRVKGLYIPKHLLRELGWKGGNLKLTIETEA